jgi:hypothetical protein
MRIIRLSADYECFPLWEASPGEVGNINPDELPISGDLKRRLLEWADEFDAILDRDDPAKSGFASAEAERRFEDTGRRLGEELKRELGADFSVIVQV